jgi:hypothetical protein
MTDATNIPQPKQVTSKNPVIAEYEKMGFEYLGLDQKTGIHHFRQPDKKNTSRLAGIYTLKNDKFFFAGYNLQKSIIRRLKK